MYLIPPEESNKRWLSAKPSRGPWDRPPGTFGGGIHLGRVSAAGKALPRLRPSAPAARMGERSEPMRQLSGRAYFADYS